MTSSQLAKSHGIIDQEVVGLSGYHVYHLAKAEEQGSSLLHIT